MNDISTTEYFEAKTLLKYKVYNSNIDRFVRYFFTSQIPSHSSNKRLIQEKVISLMRNQGTVKVISAQKTFASNLFLMPKSTEKEVLICDKSEKTECWSTLPVHVLQDEGLHLLRDTSVWDNWMVRLDLKDILLSCW